ncbi:MAG: hypothetical protein JXA03_00920 [Bacteroidales bacterium]|nr:hypothetical protein [Bacteroidales bacterium]
MTKYWLFRIFLVAGILTESCTKEVETLAGWKEIYGAWCILDIRDTAQYVRINRLFQSSTDPLEFADHPDSVNIRPEQFLVKLEEIPFGKSSDETIEMQPSQDFQKEEGDFSGDDYFVFKTTRLLKAHCEYKLIIENTETGYRMEARSAILGGHDLNYSFHEIRYFNIGQYMPEVIDYPGSLNPSQFEKRVRRFLYYEISPVDTTMKYVDWRPWLDHINLKSGNEDTAQQLSDDYLKYLAEHIRPDTQVLRLAVGVDNLLIISDELLINHYQSDSESSPHTDAICITNFDKGTGFLASRYKFTFFAMKLKPQTLDSLAYGRFTRHLGFKGSNQTMR